jgi:hypothetical protein
MRWGRWDGVFTDAYHRFGSDEFTVSEFMEVLRPHVNPMEAAREADRVRVSHRPDVYETRRKDDVTVGLRVMAQRMLRNRLRSGSVKSVDRGVFKLSERCMR